MSRRNPRIVKNVRRPPCLLRHFSAELRDARANTRAIRVQTIFTRPRRFALVGNCTRSFSRFIRRTYINVNNARLPNTENNIAYGVYTHSDGRSTGLSAGRYNKISAKYMRVRGQTASEYTKYRWKTVVRVQFTFAEILLLARTSGTKNENGRVRFDIIGAV